MSLRVKPRVFALICFLALGMSGCITIPKIDGAMEAKLNQLEAAGKPMREIKSPLLAGCLNIFPGAGEMYAGSIGNGVVTLLTFWLVYPYIMGFVDAVQEARLQNVMYTISTYEKEGFKFSLLLRGYSHEQPLAYSIRDRGPKSLTLYSVMR